MGPETIPEEKGECRVRLLLVEDDEEISAMLGDFLESEGFSVDTAADGEAGCARFSAAQYDLVLLDLMLPRRSGLDVLRAIRKSGSTVPVIILSARDSDSDVTLGLGLGADDYVVKPFSVSQVLARIKANLRRSTVWAEGAEAPAEVLRAGALAMDCGPPGGKGRHSSGADGQGILDFGAVAAQSQAGLHQGAALCCGVGRGVSGR